MIYDYQDINTKIYITCMTRKWVKTGNNALILLQNPKVKEITDADLSSNSQDDLVWTVLYLIGAGLLRYFVNDNGKRFDIAMMPEWKKPKWLNEAGAKRLMRSHIDLMMEAERDHDATGRPLTALLPSLDVISRTKTRLFRPREPNRDPQKDIELIQKNRKDYNTKLVFHRGGK